MDGQTTTATITALAPDSALNLEQFLDESFLEGEMVEERPLELALHHSAGGGGYKVLPTNQTSLP